MRLFGSARALRRLDRAAAMLRRRTWLLIVSDFLPVGRTAAMFAAGALDLPATRFYSFVVPGAIVGASFYALAATGEKYGLSSGLSAVGRAACRG
ncbi:MAG TPA: hypothetical protein VHI76_03610 [Solirubrobacterales bacterium]|nr:hypothetical protein [Solirubrobacterales bacterium]